MSLAHTHTHPVAEDWWRDIPFILPDDDFEDEDLGPADPADEPTPYTREDLDWYSRNCDHSDWNDTDEPGPSDAELLSAAEYEARVDVWEREQWEARMELFERWYREARDTRPEAWEW